MRLRSDRVLVSQGFFVCVAATPPPPNPCCTTSELYVTNVKFTGS